MKDTNLKRKKESSEESSELLLCKLREVNHKHGFCSEQSLRRLSQELKIPVAQVYAVASFYSFINTEQKGKHIIRVCNSPSCYLNGSINIIKVFEKVLGIKPGETTKDKRFSLELTSCIGCCNEAPAALIDSKPFTKLNEKRIREILKKCR